jgi:hypothetical protein
MLAMFRRAAGRRALVALGAVVATSLAVGAGSASAGRIDPPGHKDANHCSFFTGVDLNELFGVPEQFQSFFICRDELSAGEHWRPFALWITGDGVDSVYPAGYVPLRPLPIEDFVAKLTVKVVTDGGTDQQKAYVFSPAAAVRTDITLDQLDPDAPPLPMAVTMPRMKPLSVGAHTYEVTWVLSAQHCDGVSTVVEESCLPAGELPIDGGSPTVTTPTH